MRARLSPLAAPLAAAPFLALLLALSGCSHEVAPSGCVQDTDCPAEGEVCLQGECGPLEELRSCLGDLDCNAALGEACIDGLCTASGQQVQGCAATRDCPLESYCDTATSQCQPLLAGWCRDVSQCAPQGGQALCSATSTDAPGRCVECLLDQDCGNGQRCASPGVCEGGSPVPGGPGPNPDPPDAGPPPDPAPDPDTGGEEDPCYVNDWYGDDECDTFCPLPDPDCDDEPGPGGQPDPCEGGGCENDSCVQGGQTHGCASGLTCIWQPDSNGLPLYGACKRVCQSNADCGGQVCANGFLAGGDGICGAPLSEGQQGCGFWEQSSRFCFDPTTGPDDAFLECLSGTCRYVCDFVGSPSPILDCPGARSCGLNYQSHEGFGVDLAVCQ